MEVVVSLEKLDEVTKAASGMYCIKRTVSGSSEAYKDHDCHSAEKPSTTMGKVFALDHSTSYLLSYLLILRGNFLYE